MGKQVFTGKLPILFSLLLLLSLALTALPFPVAGVVTTGTAMLNVSSYINFSDGTVSNFSGHVKWDNRSGIMTANEISIQTGFLNASPGKLRNIGMQITNYTTYNLPNGSDISPFHAGDLFYNFAAYVIFGAGNAFAIMTGNYTYALIIVDGVSFGSHINITWKFQSNGSPNFGSIPNTGCLQYTTQNACFNASSFGADCRWDEITRSCQEGSGGGGGGGGGGAINVTTDCPKFDGNKAACGNITVCQWSDSGSLCDPNANFNFGVGITCPNFVNQSVCDNQPHAQPLCSWNTANDTCSGNTTKTFTNLPAVPYSNCEASPNQGNCTLLINTYFMPCEWDGNKSKCVSNMHGMFGGASGGNYFDINTKSSCEAAGGTWKTEQYIYTDQYGNFQTAISSWCEPSFGNFGKESCNDACWACEKQSDGTNWADNATAEQKCTNSTLGFCKWVPNQNAWNGQGWCEPESYIGSGFADCSTNCFGCFKNNTCRTSAANCSWVPDTFSFDTNGDGAFNFSEDGFCDKKLVAEKKDCGKTCVACQGQNACEASAATCVWNNTASFVPFCHTSGTLQEVCFLPGDEDKDGQFDCADVDSCNQDPYCGFGFGSGAGGAGLAAGAVNNTACVQHDDNQANCLLQNGTGLMNLTPVCYYHPASGQETQFPAVGWCDPIFEQNMIGGMMVGSPPAIIGFDGPNDNTSGQNWTDILDVGIHESPGAQEKLDIGMGIKNISNFAGCNKVGSYKTVTKNLTAKFYRFVDSDNNASTGCWVNGTLYGGSSPFGAQFNESGFDYKFFYTENTTSGEFKVSFKCSSGTWAPFSAQLAVMKELCQMPSFTQGGGPEGIADSGMPGGVQILVINKADIGSPKNAIRILMMTANSSNNLTSLTEAAIGSNETNPVDIAGPYYYTPGSIDKKFENCQATGQDVDGDGLTADNDPDCTLFKKFGFVPFEGGTDCKDGKDNDNNGKVDCDDVSCKYDPFSGCGFGMSCDPTDKNPPGQKWFEASSFPEGASVSFDSDEPSNGTVTFYGNDSKCITLNSTIKDFGLTDTTIGNEYKSWHDAVIDKYGVNATLSSNKTYYYKYKMCDLCGNCMTSACTNFTTSTSYSDYVFKPVPPTGLQIDIPQLGVSGNNFTYGKKINASIGQNMDITIKDPDIGYNITLHNVSVFSAATINITTLYSSNSSNKYVGINTTSWNSIMQKLGVKYVTITIPDNGTQLWKCDDDNLSNCFDMTSNASCTFGTSVTNCTMPVGAGLGFSYYGVQGTKSYGGGGSPSPSGGSSGGGGGGGGGGGSALVSESSLLQKALSTGDSGTFTYKKFASLGIYEIIAVAGAAATNPSVTVKETTLSSSTASPITAEAGKVYKYLSIAKANLENISTATIKFVVPNDWFANNSLNPSTAALNRLVSNSWVKLPTKQITSADANFASYEAASGGFSIFSITAEKAKAAAAPAAKPAETPTGAVVQEVPPPQATVEAAEQPAGFIKEKAGGLGFAGRVVWALVSLVVGILVVVEVMHFTHRKMPKIPIRMPRIPPPPVLK